MIGALAAQLDPLGLDEWFATGPPLIERAEWEIATTLNRCVTYPVPDGHDHALAELRDWDFLLCVTQRRAPGAWHAVPGLEARMLTLGKIADHVPRGCNHTYGVINPPGARLRTFTGLDSERNLIEALRAGGVGLASILADLATIALAGDGYAQVNAAQGLATAWDPMVASAARMARSMEFVEFSHQIIPWLVPLEIGGTVWRAPTGAQFSNSLIDWLLWGVGLGDPAYLSYALAFMAETPRAHREIVEGALAATGGRSLLAVLPERLPGMHRATAGAVLDGLDGLLRRIRDFRAVHCRFAKSTLVEREADVGSGMQTAVPVEMLLAHTRTARARLSRIRDEWERTCA